MKAVEKTTARKMTKMKKLEQQFKNLANVYTNSELLTFSDERIINEFVNESEINDDSLISAWNQFKRNYLS